MSTVRVFFVGGATSYRALFHWLNPWVFVPRMLVVPVTELLFFAFLGRTTHTRTDAFFVIGNSLFAAALPGLFGMGHAITGERRSQTLAVLLASPANRLALFLGRALPALVNGFLVSSVCFAVGCVLLRVDVDGASLPALAATVGLCAFSCSGLGVCVGALGLRGRNVSVIADMLTGVLLLVTGANVPVARLPGWVAQLGELLPLTHGIRAAHAIVGGAGVSAVRGPLAGELLVGAAYFGCGALMLRLLEYEARRSASLDTF